MLRTKTKWMPLSKHLAFSTTSFLSSSITKSDTSVRDNIIREMEQKIQSLSSTSSLPPLYHYDENSKDSILPIVLFGDPKLREECKPIYDRNSKKSKDEILYEQNLIAKHLCETAAHFNSFGLAAPQIGIMKRMFVVVRNYRAAIKFQLTTPEDYEVYVDPSIDSLCLQSKLLVNEERCLSIPSYQGIVSRPNCINVSYIDGTQELFVDRSSNRRQKRKMHFQKRTKKRMGGFKATIFQHELDHLNGVLYLDRMNDISLELSKD
jgi:peptide deformylase